jgi:molybdopterin-binding protein
VKLSARHQVAGGDIVTSSITKEAADDLGVAVGRRSR